MTGVARAIVLSTAAVVAAASALAAAPDAKKSPPVAARKAGAAGASAAASSSSAAPAPPVEFEGILEPGQTYLGDVQYDAYAMRNWRPLQNIKVGSKTAWAIEWIGLEKYPALKTEGARAKPQRFRFRVLTAATSSGSTTQPWMTLFRCEVLAVEAAPRPSAPAPKPR